MATSPDQTMRNRLTESAKLAVRGTLQRFDVSVSRGVHANHVARTLAAHRLDTMLDIGANVGQFALSVRRAGFDGRMISCEPLSGAYGELARRAAGDAAWEPLNVAVGRSVGEAVINVSANSYSSSILPMTDTHRREAPGSDYVATERIPLTTVAKLVDEHRVDPARALLKIDTQGYEAEVLAGANDLVRDFGALQLEISFVELYETQQLAEATIGQLRDWGYRLQTLEPGFSDETGRLLQCDILVVRDGARETTEG